jgi:ribosomal protein S18 acetylase RimI-like enzyme
MPSSISSARGKTQSPRESMLESKEKVEVKRAQDCDLPSIHSVEVLIEGENAATQETLGKRLQMFPGGFFTITVDKAVIGYVQSTIWNDKEFQTFEEIKNFPNHHEPEGRTLYVIFLGVHPDHRRKGLGTKLMKSLIDFAQERHLEKVQLVSAEESKESLADFYRSLGFVDVRKLPNFLPYGSGILMERTLNHTV